LIAALDLPAPSATAAAFSVPLQIGFWPTRRWRSLTSSSISP